MSPLDLDFYLDPNAGPVTLTFPETGLWLIRQGNEVRFREAKAGETVTLHGPVMLMRTQERRKGAVG